MRKFENKNTDESVIMFSTYELALIQSYMVQLARQSTITTVPGSDLDDLIKDFLRL